jgi:hypothetical protein
MDVTVTVKSYKITDFLTFSHSTSHHLTNSFSIESIISLEERIMSIRNGKVEKVNTSETPKSPRLNQDFFNTKVLVPKTSALEKNDILPPMKRKLYLNKKLLFNLNRPRKACIYTWVCSKCRDAMYHQPDEENFLIAKDEQFVTIHKKLCFECVVNNICTSMTYWRDYKQENGTVETSMDVRKINNYYQFSDLPMLNSILTTVSFVAGASDVLNISSFLYGI